MAGAAILAARAALRTGVGFLRIASPPENREHPSGGRSGGGLCRRLGSGCAGGGRRRRPGPWESGPGMGTEEEGRRILEQVLESQGPGRPSSWMPTP